MPPGSRTKEAALRKRYYIIFVAREADGRLRKVPVPLHYVYGFVAAAVVGLFTMTGMAGSYGRMLVKMARFNQMRSQKEALQHDYVHMQQVVRDKDLQVASLGSLASEVTALYGLRQGQAPKAALDPVAEAPLIPAGGPAAGDYLHTLGQLTALRSSALSGRMRRMLEPSFGFGDGDDWGAAMDMPTLWPIEGPITSSFGERQDPFNGEGAFHKGIDIAGAIGEPVRAPADGTVLMAGPASGYGQEIVLDHGHGIRTLFGHLSAFAVTAGEDVRRGDVIGYVGDEGRSTGPHLHYEVRLHETPVNPHRYLSESLRQFAAGAGTAGHGAGGTTAGMF